MMDFPDSIEIVCSKERDGRRHERVVVYSHEVNLAEGVIRAPKKVFEPDGQQSFGFDRLDSTQLFCSRCKYTYRIKDADLTNLLGHLGLAAAASTSELQRDAVMRGQELRGIGGMLRAIR
jgi:hypothetical protein